MFRTSILRAALMASFLLIASSASALETITFDDDSLFHGDTITSVSGNNGSGPIAVFGDNPVDPGMGNWATAFDSNAPTCGDDDLGSPNESCLGGGPGVGADGEPTGANPNCSTLNNVLILQEINCDGGSCSEVCSPGPGSDPHPRPRPFPRPRPGPHHRPALALIVALLLLRPCAYCRASLARPSSSSALQPVFAPGSMMPACPGTTSRALTPGATSHAL